MAYLLIALDIDPYPIIELELESFSLQAVLFCMSSCLAIENQLSCTDAVPLIDGIVYFGVGNRLVYLVIGCGARSDNLGSYKCHDATDTAVLIHNHPNHLQ